MSEWWPLRRLLGYGLAIAACAAGVWLLLGQWEKFAPFERRPPIRLLSIGQLTGRDAAGRLEVPVINLWERPGFGPDNRVKARVHLPETGEVEVRVTERRTIDGVAWNEVEVRGTRGWVTARFVE